MDLLELIEHYLDIYYVNLGTAEKTTKMHSMRGWHAHKCLFYYYRVYIAPTPLDLHNSYDPLPQRI